MHGGAHLLVGQRRRLAQAFTKLCRIVILLVSPKGIACAPARAAKPIQVLTEEHKRARRIFARLMGGELMRAIAASENLSLRRVQQIVRAQLIGATPIPLTICAAPDRAARAGARSHRFPDRRRQACGGACLRAHPRPSEPPRARPPLAQGRVPTGRRRSRQYGGSARPPRRRTRGFGAQAGKNGRKRPTRESGETKTAPSP